MRAAELIALASASHLDLQQAARMVPKSRPSDVTTKKHANGHTSTVLNEMAQNRVRGSQTRAAPRPQWTIAEIGIAASCLSNVCFSAACYAYAGEMSQYHKLYVALAREAKQLQHRESWPTQVQNVHRVAHEYHQDLSKLVLDQDANPHLFTFAEGRLYSIYMNVTEKTWEKQLSERFELLQKRWTHWLDVARGTIQSKLNEED